VPEVVFLPGFMQHADSWSPIAAAVGERYPVHVLDFATWTFEQRLEEIYYHGSGAVLVGYSMGGRLALHAAVRRPDAFAGVVTIGSAAGIEDVAARQRRREADEELAAWIEAHSIAEVVARWEQNPVFASQSAELVEAQRPGRLDHEPAQLARLLRSAGQGAQEPVWARLGALRMPVLALAGEHDGAYRAAAERIAVLVADAEAGVIEGAGHAAHLEAPGETTGRILGWLS
jgi:2-succinyl-6-hydroxy-2,4-cyclohexadiene-1-carboxylate synthase